MGEELWVALQITKSPAKLSVIIGNEVFRILVQVEGGEGGAWALSFPFLVGRGHAGGWG